MRSERRFRPMGIRDILDETFDLYKSNFPTLLAIVAIVQGPIGILSLYLLSRSAGGPYGSSQLPYAVLAFASNFLIAAPATWAVSEAYLGRRPAVAEAYRSIRRRALAFAETYIIWLCAVTAPMVVTVALWIGGVGFLFASVIHGVRGMEPSTVPIVVCVLAISAGALACWMVVSVWLMFTPVAFVVEDKQHLSALRRSRELIRSHWWRVLGTILLVLILVSIIHAGLVSPLRAMAGEPHYLVVMAFSMIVAMLLWPLPLITTILLYYDLRIRKEGFDLEILADEMGDLRASGREDSPEA